MEPQHLNLAEIRKFMIENNCKVTNHSLVKHFKRFLTNPDTQTESRKKFKTYVNILATIKTEDNQKYLILRKKYVNECPTEDDIECTNVTSSSASISINSEGFNSPYRQPPPYKPPPEVSSPSAITASKMPPQFQLPMPSLVPPVLQTETKENYRDCINEFAAVVRKIDPNRILTQDPSQQMDAKEPELPPRKHRISRENSKDENKENVTITSNSDNIPIQNTIDENAVTSVKETTRKFNRLASQEEAKVISPPTKKKPEKERNQQQIVVSETNDAPKVTITHPKAKEWMVSMAKANYQELAKLASEYPELVSFKDPHTYTALHWASKHGNEDIIKMIAGTYKANVNARTNGGYTPLHVSMQFGKDNIFELLCNVYKADRDLMDWSGNKPLDYRKQRTTVSASTYSKIKARRKNLEKDLGFLRIGSLNARVKKTTEAFSNFLGTNHSNTPYSLTVPTIVPTRSSVPSSIQEKLVKKIHKTWGSVDNIQKTNITEDNINMPAPKNANVKRKSKRRICPNDTTGYASMPSTPNNIRATIAINPENQSDSDSACGFDANWH